MFKGKGQNRKKIVIYRKRSTTLKYEEPFQTN